MNMTKRISVSEVQLSLLETSAKPVGKHKSFWVVD